MGFFEFLTDIFFSPSYFFFIFYVIFVVLKKKVLNHKKLAYELNLIK